MNYRVKKRRQAAPAVRALADAATIIDRAAAENDLVEALAWDFYMGTKAITVLAQVRTSPNPLRLTALVAEFLMQHHSTATARKFLQSVAAVAA